MNQGPMEVENEEISSLKERKGTQYEDEIQQDPRLDEIEKLIKNLEINPQKFNGPGQRPKTANKAFGSLSDFALFLENRNPEMKEFAHQFEKIEKMDVESSMVELSRVIIPKIEECLEKMYKKIKAMKKPNIRYKNKYADLFHCELNTWEDFYQRILHAYTINSFLFRKMNRDLRNENWMKLDALLPYVYCLFKAFLWGPIGLNIQEDLEVSKGNFEALKEKSINNKLILYRRADFDDDSLNFYDTNKIKYFSWNGIISTSLVESLTLKFQGNPSKRPILITIEIDFADLKPKDLNALYLATFSAMPKEEEVAIPPGSIFELLDIKKEKPEVEMRLRLVTNTKALAHKGQFLHGMLQEIMRNEDELKFVCLKEKELSRAIRHCQGNRLIKHLEFDFCTFNEKAVEALKEVIPTLENLTSLTLDIVRLEECCRLDRIFECIEKKRVKRLLVLATLSEKREIQDFINNMKHLSKLEYLKLSFEEDCQINLNLFKSLLKSSCQHLNPGCILDIHIGKNYNVTIKGSNLIDIEQSGLIKALISSWPAGLSSPPKSLIETEPRADDNKKMQHLERIRTPAAKSLTTIRIENMRSLKNWKVMDERNVSVEINESSRGACQYDFEGRKRGTLCEVLENKFIFSSAKKESNRYITESQRQDAMQEKLERQFREGAEQRVLLTSLHFTFEKIWMTDNEISLLCSHGLRHFQSLTTLILIFGGISDNGLKILSYEGIKHLKSLTSLHLDFGGHSEITEISLRSQMRKHLRSPTSFPLYLSSWLDHIRNEGLKTLCSEGIRHLGSLTSLHLDFEDCEKMTDEGLKTLGSVGIRHLGSLTSLNLNFRSCAISDEGLKTLCSEGIQYLRSLTSLHLDFEDCEKMTDEGLKTLGSVGIRHLGSLTSLYLNLRYCAISDEGLKTLCSEGIKYLPQLTTLHMNFGDSKIQIVRPNVDRKIYDVKAQRHQGLAGLFRNSVVDTTDVSLKPLESSRSQGLESCASNPITDQGLRALCSEGIQSLRSLTSLHLDFKYCNKITDRGFKSLSSEGIKYLPFLTSLSLIFQKCKISKETIEDIFSMTQPHLRLTLNKFLDRLSIQSSPKILSKPSFQKLSNSPTTTAFVVYDVNPGFYLKSSPFKCERNFSELLKNHPPFDFEDLGVFCRSDFSKQIRRNSDVTFHLNFKCGLIDDTFTNRKDITSSWQDVKTLNLVFDESQLLSAQRLQNYWNIPLYFKSIFKLHLSSNEENFPLDELLQSLFSGIIESLESLRSLNCIFPNTSMSEMVQKQILEASSKLSVNLIIFTKRKFELKTTGLQMKKQIPQMSLWKRKCQRDGTKMQKTKISAQRNIEKRNSFSFEDLIEMNSNQCIRQKGFNKEIIDNPHKNVKMELKLALQTESIFFSDFKSLLKLSLNFFGCSDMTNERLINLSIGISCLKILDILDLSFYGCRRITDEGLSSFVYQGLKQLGKLTEISLDFGFCTGITDNGVDYLAREGINHLKRLTKLDLGFKCNQYITERGLESLSENIIKNLELLTNLRLIFSDCTEITDIGLQLLSYNGIHYLESLTSLTLYFCGCQKISNQGMKSLICGTASRLQSLTHLDLSFGASNSNGITDEGFWGLCREAIFPLKSLLSLRLKIHIRRGISDEGLECLFCEGLRSLEALTSLEFISPGENRITEKGIISIAFKGMSSLLQLENLQISLSQIFTVSSSLYEAFNRILVYFGLKEREDEGS